MRDRSHLVERASRQSKHGRDAHASWYVYLRHSRNKLIKSAAKNPNLPLVIAEVNKRRCTLPTRRYDPLLKTVTGVALRLTQIYNSARSKMTTHAWL